MDSEPEVSGRLLRYSHLGRLGVSNPWVDSPFPPQILESAFRRMLFPPLVRILIFLEGETC
jgi:hypothetical protein